MRIKCVNCSEAIELRQGATSYGCLKCGHYEDMAALEFENSDAEDAIGQATLVDSSEDDIPPPLKPDRVDEAEDYFLKATFILHSLQANLSVYGSNSAWQGAEPADVELAIKYVDRSLEIWPDNPKYINLKALFLIEGLGQKEAGVKLMERAAELAPNDITLQSNLEKSKQDSCFIASAVFESENHRSVMQLRHFRDQQLMNRSIGRRLIKSYYHVGPYFSRIVFRFPKLRYPLKQLFVVFGRMFVGRL